MTNVADKTDARVIPDVIRIDQEQVRSHVDEVVRSTVEETLNGLLEQEADRLCGASRYERASDRVDTRAGHYSRKLLTKAGEVKLRVPRLRSLPSRRRSSSGIGDERAVCRSR